MQKPVENPRPSHFVRKAAHRAVIPGLIFLCVVIWNIRSPETAAITVTGSGTTTLDNVRSEGWPLLRAEGASVSAAVRNSSAVQAPNSGSFNFEKDLMWPAIAAVLAFLVQEAIRRFFFERA